MSLNLSRLLRPRKFSELLGQDLLKTMLLNSLYLQKYFPAYLFAGQRGCGKTTAARLFAKAVNCQKPPDFLKNPAIDLPCDDCVSCVKMQKETHPDFLEIDGASHTGVENVRQILESASYQPVLGQKKIYLIDEAHMLSKAAFNAFLKLLEEPPKTALFIMATTEMNKIPTTVRSRCFVGHFAALPSDVLRKILLDICSARDVVIEPEALNLLMQISQFSARDAINQLEQLLLFGKKIDQKLVESTCLAVHPARLCSLFCAIVTQDVDQVSEILHSAYFAAYSPAGVWQAFLQLLQAIFYIKLDVESADQEVSFEPDQLEFFKKQVDLPKVQKLCAAFWQADATFMQTTHKPEFLRYFFLQLAKDIAQAPASSKEKVSASPRPYSAAKASDSSRQSSANSVEASSSRSFEAVGKSAPNKPDFSANQSPVQPVVAKAEPQPAPQVVKGDLISGWTEFLQCELFSANKPLQSVLGQASKTEQVDGVLRVFVPKVTPFYTSMVQDANLGQSLATFFSGINRLELVHNGQILEPVAKKTFSRPQEAQAGGSERYQSASRFSEPSQKNEDFSDQSKWPVASMLLDKFPGKITIEE